MIYKNEELLNKGCQVRIKGQLYFCYNVTSLLHFVKCGAKDQILKPNAKNCLNLNKQQLLNLINLEVAAIEVGAINK